MILRGFWGSAKPGSHKKPDTAYTMCSQLEFDSSYAFDMRLVGVELSILGLRQGFSVAFWIYTAEMTCCGGRDGLPAEPVICKVGDTSLV
jgi:hypothetical protein